MAITEYVEIGGKKRPVRFDYMTIYLWSKVTKKRIEALIYVASLSFDEVVDLCRAGLYRGTQVEKPVEEITIEQVCEWLTERPKAQVEIMKIFYESAEKLWGDPDLGKDQTGETGNLQK